MVVTNLIIISYVVSSRFTSRNQETHGANSQWLDCCFDDALEKQVCNDTPNNVIA